MNYNLSQDDDLGEMQAWFDKIRELLKEIE